MLSKIKLIHSSVPQLKILYETLGFQDQVSVDNRHVCTKLASSLMMPCWAALPLPLPASGQPCDVPPSSCRVIERSNLLNMLKISIKGLIDSSMRLGCTLSDEHVQLQQFLILMEHTLKHRIKGM